MNRTPISGAAPTSSGMPWMRTALQLRLISGANHSCCSSLISGLLLFFFPGVPAHAESLPHQLSLAVRVTERLASCLPSVRFDAARFRQALEHLTRTRVTAHRRPPAHAVGSSH